MSLRAEEKKDEESVSAACRVAPPLRTPLITRRCRTYPAAEGSTLPYVDSFDRVMDRALLEDCLEVVVAEGHLVKGHRVIHRAEMAYEFWPSRPWEDRCYILISQAWGKLMSGSKSVVVLSSILSLSTIYFRCELALAIDQRVGAELAPTRGADRIEEKHLEILDDMDFNIFSHKKWGEISKSHADSVIVQNPDGTTTSGLPEHIEGMKRMASYMPDLRISSHPVRIASGDWTGIIGVIEGTFTRPMPNPSGGASIPPTGKSLRANIATISHWRDGKMDKEYLFMDDADFAKQLGLTQGAPAVKGDVGPLPVSGKNEGVAPDEMQRRLGVLDNMDFVVWSNQQWAKIPQSHADQVVAVFPDGRVSHGIQQHIEDMKQMFTWAPNSKIKEHPVEFGQGNWTVLIGIMEGDFTNPMELPGMKPIAPTGKHFKVPMATYSHWDAEGKMDIEFVFWDNASWMRQLGVAG